MNIQSINLKKQTNAFAMQSGMMFGLLWCVSFLFLVSGSPSMNTLSHLLIFSTPFFGFWFARKFRKDVENDGKVSFGRGYFFSLLLYLYATAVLAIASYLYFRFIDHGAFAQHNIALLDTPDVKQIFNMPEMQKQMGGLTLADIKELFRVLTPTTFAAIVINFNAMAAFVLAFPTAFFAMTANKNAQTKINNTTNTNNKTF